MQQHARDERHQHHHTRTQTPSTISGTASYHCVYDMSLLSSRKKQQHSSNSNGTGNTSSALRHLVTIGKRRSNVAPKPACQQRMRTLAARSFCMCLLAPWVMIRTVCQASSFVALSRRIRHLPEATWAACMPHACMHACMHACRGVAGGSWPASAAGTMQQVSPAGQPPAARLHALLSTYQQQHAKAVSIQLQQPTKLRHASLLAQLMPPPTRRTHTPPLRHPWRPPLGIYPRFPQNGPEPKGLMECAPSSPQ